MKQALSLTPPASPLAMPSQILGRRPSARLLAQAPSTLAARVLTFAGSLILTVAAGYQMFLVTPLHDPMAASAPLAPSVTALLWLLLGLFTANFAWISLSATAALAGVLASCLQHRNGRRDGPAPNAPLRGRTVLLMSIYNEDAVSAFAALAAMGEDLGNIGLHEHFEIFVLSDSNRPDILAAEAEAVTRLRGQLRETMPVWYRRRGQNTGRKAGNIRDFVSRWGNDYEYMVVLDADSLIAGETLATLVREMDADPKSGILQTLPRLSGGETLFARLQQFSGIVYGPVFSRGLCAWQGDDGNYWGHNAIIRIGAFAASAGLPTLPGRRPFGGEIRSHDFVEAALIRRAGWSVRMLPGLSKSWEECPPTLLDAAIRDRRWAQGNVQHLAVLPARGLRWPSRAHMLMGVMNYLSSLLWLAMVAVGLLLSTGFALPDMDATSVTLSPVFDTPRMVGLFVLTMGLLLLPKILGMTMGLFSESARGGMQRQTFLYSVILELMFSVLHAPVFMLLHSRHLWEIARGRDSGWSAQQRNGTDVRWSHLLANHSTHTALGILVMTLVFWLPSSLLYWMLPIVLGLVLSIPLSGLSGSTVAGQWLARRGLLGIPEERELPRIMQRRQAYQASMRQVVPAKRSRDTATASA